MGQLRAELRVCGQLRVWGQLRAELWAELREWGQFFFSNRCYKPLSNLKVSRARSNNESSM